MSVKPDFTRYTHAELLDALEHIDAEKFPDRVETIHQLIARRETEGDILKEVKPNQRWLRVKQWIKSRRFSQWLSKTFIGKVYRYFKNHQWGTTYIEGEASDRWDQWFAFKLDGFLLSLITTPILIVISVAFSSFVEENVVTFFILSYAIVIIVYFSLHGYYLVTRSQTLGKHLVGIQIKTMDGQRASFQRIIFVRSLSYILLSIISFGVYPLLNLFFVLRKNKRSLHDYIARTRLVYDQAE